MFLAQSNKNSSFLYFWLGKNKDFVFRAFWEITPDLKDFNNDEKRTVVNLVLQLKLKSALLT